MLKGELGYIVEDFVNALFHRFIIFTIFFSFIIFLYSMFLFYRSTDFKKKVKSWFNNNFGFLFSNNLNANNLNDVLNDR